MLQIVKGQKQDQIANEIVTLTKSAKIKHSNNIPKQYLAKDCLKSHDKPQRPKKEQPRTSKYWGLTPEQHRARLDKNNEARRKRMAAMTPEEREAFNKHNNRVRRWRRRNLKGYINQQNRYYHHQNKEERNAKLRANYALLTPEERTKLYEDNKDNIKKFK